MNKSWNNLDDNSKEFVKELSKEGINIDKLINKLQKAKRKVNGSEKLAEALNKKFRK